MKKILSAVVISMLISGVASANTTVIEENFDTANIEFARIHHLNDKLNVYTFDENFNPVAGDLTQPVTTYVRGRNLYVNDIPTIEDEGPLGEHTTVMSFGTSTVDSVEGWTGWYGHENLVYTFNELGTGASVSFKYLNDRDGRGTITVIIEEVNDNGERQWVKSIKFPGSEETEGWQDLYVSPEEIETMAAGRSFNRIHICEWDIGTEGNSYIDDVVITFETPNPTPDSLDNVKYVSVEKEGWYTAEFTQGTGIASIYVNDTLNGEFINGNANIGYLYEGDTIALTLDGKGADTVDTIDWQAWDFNFNNGDVKIHVEDPVMVCSDEELTASYDEGFTAGVDSVEPEVIEVIKEVPVEVIKEVEVPAPTVCDNLTSLSGWKLKKATTFCHIIEKLYDKVEKVKTDTKPAHNKCKLSCGKKHHERKHGKKHEKKHQCKFSHK